MIYMENDYGINLGDGRYKAISEIRKAKCVIFDLDGTLVNTIDDLGLACDYLLKKQGIEPHWSANDYKEFVGNGAKLLVQRAFDYKLTDEELDEQYALFKIKYDEIKLEHAYAYEGIREVLEALKANGVKLAVCTNKPDIAAKGMVEELFGKDLFDYIQGALDDKPKKPDTALPNIILNALSVNPEDVVWIGDSDVDIASADNIGCKSIAVTWGFRSYEVLSLSHPTLILDSPKDILNIFNFSIDN